MGQILLSFFIAVAMTFCFSRFVIPFCIRYIPLPVQRFQKINIIQIFVVFVTSFVISYYICYNEPPLAAHIDPQPKNNATREAARVLALEALRQGTALSVTVSKLPKQEKVYRAAKELLAISPRYQEQVDLAEAGLNDVKDKSRKIFGNYINKVIELGRYKTEYISLALDLIQNGDLTSREKIVADLLNEHVNSLNNSKQANSVQWLSDFTKRFSAFVD